MNADQVELLRRYLVTDGRVESLEQLLEICRCALAGGVTTVQLRAKNWTDRQLLNAACELRQMCSESGALFVVNDRVDIALASRADGVHLGVDDLPVDVARNLLGPASVIGYSPETAEDRVQAETAGADYLGIGPVYGTATKLDAGPALGLDRFRQLTAASTVPVVGIGGISPDAARPVIEAGAAGVAVVGAIFAADNPEHAARQLAEEVG